VPDLVREILTKISVAAKAGKRRGTVYRSPRIYLPTKLTDDSTFPFSGGEPVKVEIVKDRLVISRARLRGSCRQIRRRKIIYGSSGRTPSFV